MDEADKSILLKLARDSISSYFDGKKPDVSKARHLNEKRGLFVTLHDRNGKLRGCIGFPRPANATYIAVVEAARSAAFHDSRFAPLKKDDLAWVRIEISLLSAPKLIEITHYNDYMKKITLGTDGLVIEHPQGSGLLLPQVATENNFNTKSFLNALAQKAGLSFNAWMEPQSRIYKFSAEVFSEK